MYFCLFLKKKNKKALMEREKKREKKKKICSKLTKSLERDVALVSLLLTLNIFHFF